ncbi:MAG: hypothetical protein A2Y03_00740 [Omnitrophica WOR_2 bacterium GWF2_38_59]|nr:MAG: hypothetical protein A2Y03_00740 [Omnitrophica WOR_2 bacterium GWF2_38_59]OGX46882.1 MAG: hypothetical protein A2243_11860 [Omnitrophica WOR_2 bacterium RIFOXYA2_FULL_38_17]OGX52608.1 MAG: hypothetical protein A2267_03835 [Omnitrophica WOR_2 bacterium RIFOXYA12_FULL_38_10]OGX55500.1 MAG: hypothetical protein A2447_05740 [Omnitrophica WOR_2 bacterium RIFOXYC2_FULL_38_12]OGX58501.1 MAG: hypothetical protein A2306_03695 [Omnitrophica WOR_2 bacterium RIFOXYB2_FULL_38_16]HBG60584.1 hypothet
MNENKKNIPLIVSLSIPVLMIALVAISIYVPTIFVKPKMDFVYSIGRDYCYLQKYSVQNSKIVENEIKEAKDPNYCHNNSREPKLYYYDVEKDSTKQITFEEASKYILDSSYSSEDGFSVVSGSGHSDLFFYNGSSYYKKYIKKGAFSKKLNIGADYYYDFNFLGWVKG